MATVGFPVQYFGAARYFAAKIGIGFLGLLGPFLGFPAGFDAGFSWISC